MFVALDSAAFVRILIHDRGWTFDDYERWLVTVLQKIFTSTLPIASAEPTQVGIADMVSIVVLRFTGKQDEEGRKRRPPRSRLRAARDHQGSEDLFGDPVE